MLKLWNILALSCVLLIGADASAQTGDSFVSRVIAGAREEVRKGTVYDGSGYYEIPYPNGDISPRIGVCTDLVIRAFRHAGLDLQKLVHEDRAKSPKDYPTHLWEKKESDTNIDHRRCQNLYVFKKFGKTVTNDFSGENIKEWKAGDVVFFLMEGQKYPWHVGLISEQPPQDGFPMMIHLFPPAAQEESIEKYTPIHSHFRWKEAAKPKPARKAKPAPKK